MGMKGKGNKGRRFKGGRGSPGGRDRTPDMGPRTSDGRPADCGLCVGGVGMWQLRLGPSRSGESLGVRAAGGGRGEGAKGRIGGERRGGREKGTADSDQ